MKYTGAFLVVLVLAGSCRESCREKIVRLYSGAQQVLTGYREVNNFAMQLSYMPASLLIRPEKGEAVAVRDTAFYYFRLNVVNLETAVPVAANKTELYYGLDSVFATSETNPKAIPVLVEPVITGSSKNFEYLLVFAKKDFTENQVKVVFFDRLFTNTKQVFVFDRKKIDEIENLQCHSHEA